MTCAGIFKSLVVTFVLMPAAVAGGSRSLPFAPGEKLSYQVRWEKVPVARLSLEVQPFKHIQGASAYHFVFQVQTEPAVSALYPVQGHIEAFADRALARSLRLTKDMREGRSRRVFQVDFDWQRGVAVYARNARRQRRMALTEGTLDMLSILYYARSLSLTPGMSLTRPLNSGKKIRRARARVLGQETILVGGRPWSALRIEVDVQEAGGIFEKSEDAALSLWLSADTRKIPLKVVSKVWVGSFIVELTGARPSWNRAGTDSAG